MMCSSAQLSKTRIPIFLRLATGNFAMLTESNFAQSRFSGSMRRSSVFAGLFFSLDIQSPRFSMPKTDGLTLSIPAMYVTKTQRRIGQNAFFYKFFLFWQQASRTVPAIHLHYGEAGVRPRIRQKPHPDAVSRELRV